MGSNQGGDDKDYSEETKISKVLTRPADATRAKASLVVVYVPLDNPAAAADLGRRIPIEGDVTVGRHPNNTLQLDQDDVSRRHAEVYFEEGDFYVKDLGSRNGTAVNDADLGGSARALKDGDRIGIGSTILKFIQSDTENQFHEVIYRIKVEDALTRIHNKRYLLEYLEREMARALRHKSPMSLILYDIDHFKKVNDTYGHLAGDAVLRDTAALVKTMVRKEECYARYGGEEFCLVEPEVPCAVAASVAEKIRKGIEAGSFGFEDKKIPVTVSLGVAELEASMTDPAAFIKKADERLYKAKQSGRNRTVFE